MTEVDHVARVKKELQDAGITHLGMLRFTSRHIHNIIHPDEHILAAVYGRRYGTAGDVFGFGQKSGRPGGFFGYEEGLLAATDKRVLYLVHRPGYTSTDEIGYDKISGANVTQAALFAAVTLFTKIGTYTLSFAHPKAARHFCDTIENLALRKPSDEVPNVQSFEKTIEATDAVSFLNNHEIGVLSSIDRAGNVTGAAIYYTLIGNRIYFVTKTGTKKADNLIGEQHAAFTVFDEAKRQTVQLQGVVEVEINEQLSASVIKSLINNRTYSDGEHTPPAAKLSGDAIVFHIIPTKVDYTDYSKRG